MSHASFAATVLPTTLVDLLEQRVAGHPEQRIFSFLVDGEQQAAYLTYAELVQQARRIAAGLQEVARAGDRALLLYPPGLDYIAAFFGCLYAGVVAVPAYPPNPARLDRTLPRLQAIVVDAQPSVILTTTPILSMASLLVAQSPVFQVPRWLATDAIPDEAAQAWRAPVCGGDTLAFLQYTSGSTATPKGVMLSHANLLYNSLLIHQGFGHGPTSRGVIWLPPYHDMGLIGGIIQPIYGDFPVTLLSPIDFLQRPFRWLQAISRTQATTSGGPNFAYDLCVRKVTPEQIATLDLRSWSVAFNGAEPIRAETLDRFATMFAPCGFRRSAFYPCYGLAEATLIVSGGVVSALPEVGVFSGAALDRHQVVPVGDLDAQARVLVGSGRALGDGRVVIVDAETGVRCAPEQVGEVWVASSSVAQGYWRSEAASVQAFGAVLADSGEGPFLRTGDLGFVRDGALFITGRLKDLIIIRGRNVYPQDVEVVAERSHPLLRQGCGAAFAVERGGEEQLVIVQEVEREARALDVEGVIAAIRRAVAEQLDVHVAAVVVLKAGALPKTSSGKVQRHACRAAFLADGLEAIGRSSLVTMAEADEAALTRDELLGMVPARRVARLERYLMSVVARLLHVAPSQVDRLGALVGLGLDSLMVVEVQHEVASGLGVVLSLARLLEGQSVAGVAVDVLDQLEAQGVPGDDGEVVYAQPMVYPLSYGQRALWFLHQLAPQSAAYNLSSALHVRAAMDAVALSVSLRALVERHAALRTTFDAVGGEPQQQVRARGVFGFQVVDVAGVEGGWLQAWMTAEAHRPFDLVNGPLLRVSWCRVSPEESYLLLVVHHIVADLWSLAVLVHEFDQLYAAAVAGRALPVLPAVPSYAAFVRQQAQVVAGEQQARLVQYWRSQLVGAPAALDVPCDYARPSVQTYAGAACALTVGAELTQALRVLAQQSQATLYMVLLAAFQVLLYRHTGQADVVVGSPTSGRDSADFAGVVGYFVNLLAIRARMGGNPSFRVVLEQVRRTMLDALEHQSLPFAMVVEHVLLERDASRSPVFQAVFVLQTVPQMIDAQVPAFAVGAGEMCLGGVPVAALPLDRHVTPFDVTLMMAETEAGLVGSLQYNTDLFERGTMERMAGHYEVLLAGVVAAPDMGVAEVPILTAAEEARVAVWNARGAEYPRVSCIADLVGAQAAAVPDRVALVFTMQHLTYRVLDERGNQVAHALRARGVRADALVGLCVERSLAMVVGMVGILKAGAAYVPLDPAYPLERVAYMVADTCAPVVLTEAAVVERVPAQGSAVVCLDRDWVEIGQYPTAAVTRQVAGGQRAYVIYTSGSTGRPKGVMVTQQGLLNLCFGLRAFFDDPQVQTTGLITSMSFDISVNQIFPSLVFGRTLHIIPDAVKYDSAGLAQYLDAQQIDLVDIVPSHLHALLTALHPARLLNTLRYILIGGEKVESRLVQKSFGQLGSGMRLVNIYGLTEITDINAFGVIGVAEQGEVMTVGRPLQNNRIYITNERWMLQPVGVAGELCVSGESVSRGYLNRPELTAEKFVVCPFEDGAVMCRTGDLARWREDGRIEVLGRMDHQVKVNGFRVEVGEVEAVLEGHEQVRECVVVLRGGRLVGYVVGEVEGVPSGEELRQYVRGRVPEHMVPALFVWLAVLPRTPNGKIDRNALPVPESGVVVEEERARTVTEGRVAEIWADVLEVEQVGREEGFFALGGHSLLATQVLSRIKTVFGVEVPLRRLFETPTVAGLARHIDEALQATSGVPPLRRSASRDESPPLSFAQQRLWLLDQFEPGNPVYNIPIVVHLRGHLVLGAWVQSLNVIVQRHEALRARFSMRDGQPCQVIVPQVVLPLVVQDLSGLAEQVRVVAQDRLAAAEAQRSFDLARDLLIRVRLLRLAADEHVLLLTMHHIVSDGWSLGVFVDELATLYRAACRGVPVVLPDLEFQYSDFARWQAEWLQGAVLERQLAYWKEQLAGAPPLLELPTDRMRMAMRTYRGATEVESLPVTLSEAVRELSRQEVVTPFMTLLTAFMVILHRYTGQEDIVVGTPIAGRTQVGVERLIGFFLNTLVLRADLAGQPRFRELLGRVREVCLGAYAHQDLPFEKLVEELHPDRDLSHTPLFQVYFNMLNFPNQDVVLPDLAMEFRAPPDIGAKFDLTLYVEEKAQRFHFHLVYNADLFQASQMRELLGQFHGLLEQVVADPAVSIVQVSLVTLAARRWLPDPAAVLDASWHGSIQQALARQAQRVPGHVAIIDPHESWTYAELDARSSQFANYLIAQGIARGDSVAIYAHRSAALVWALMGVLKAGAAFVVLDPTYPASRLIGYLQIAEPRGWVQIDAAGGLSQELAQFVATLPLCCVCTLPRYAEAAALHLFSGYTTEDPCVVVGPDDSACVGFTSGSTGVPKGILGRHGPLTHFMPWQAETFGLCERDRFSMLSGLAHDPLQRDMFTPLWLGATICIPNPEDMRVPGRLAAWMAQLSVSVAHLTPALGQVLTEIEPGVLTSIPSLRYAFIVGDVLTRQDVARIRLLAPSITCVNFYGSTETQRAVGYYVISDDVPLAPHQARLREILPLGRGMPDVQLLVLNADQQLAGIGEVGEIYVRSPHLARGYLGDAALSAERFIADRFAGVSAVLEGAALGVGTRLYRTGDMGRYMPDGIVEFFGRADHQVKIRGFRVELGEIEAVLGRHPAVREVVASVREDIPGDRRLVAYVVPHPAQTPVTGDVRQFLQAQLPHYMIPSAFVWLEALPLTPNGKVDRRALPRPDGRGSDAVATYVAPQTDMEQVLAAVWREVLHIEVVGVDDNFFELGGSSLHIVQLHSKLRSVLDRDVPILEMFNYPTIGALARYLSHEQHQATPSQEHRDRIEKQKAAMKRQRQQRSRS